MHPDIKVLNAHYSAPMNGSPGLYVQLLAPYAVLRSDAAVEAACEVATWFGFDPDGRGSAAGVPSEYGPRLGTKSYWFYDVNGRSCTSTPEGNRAIRAAIAGPKAVYEYTREDPRLKET